jgi:hypothetical protein
MKWNVSHFSTVYVTWNSWKFIFSWNFIGFQWTKRVPLMKWIPWHTHEVHGFFVFNQTFVVEDKVEDPPRPIDCSVSDRRVTSTPSQLCETIQVSSTIYLFVFHNTDTFCLPPPVGLTLSVIQFILEHSHIHSGPLSPGFLCVRPGLVPLLDDHMSIVYGETE